MPFIAIKGRFMPMVGQPDGDSVRFRADDGDLWERLEGRPARVSARGATLGTVQLRFEGIDTIEREALQPLATRSRENMERLIGRSATNPEPAGAILSRMTDDQSGRPIAFVFAGESAFADGERVFLSQDILRRSANWGQVRDGFAYPLYYNTLFADLRRGFDEALVDARSAGRGLWPQDATQLGVEIASRDQLARIPPIWPKLWRRLREYLGGGRALDGFVRWLEEAKHERVDVLSEMEERGLHDLVEVRGARVRLLVPPEDIRVVGEAGGRRPRVRAGQRENPPSTM